MKYDLNKINSRIIRDTRGVHKDLKESFKSRIINNPKKYPLLEEGKLNCISGPIISNKKLPLNERFAAQLKLSKLPKNSARTRVRNRCEITGRPHGVYRKLRISRIALRQMASAGKIPGMTKSSW